MFYHSANFWIGMFFFSLFIGSYMYNNYNRLSEVSADSVKKGVDLITSLQIRSYTQFGSAIHYLEEK